MYDKQQKNKSNQPNQPYLFYSKRPGHQGNGTTRSGVADQDAKERIGGLFELDTEMHQAVRRANRTVFRNKVQDAVDGSAD